MRNILKLNIVKKSINFFGLVLILIGIIFLLFNMFSNIIGIICIITGFSIQILFISILNKKEQSIIEKITFLNVLNDLKVANNEREYHYFILKYLAKIIYKEMYKEEVDEKEKMVLNSFMNLFLKNISEKHFVIKSEVLDFEKKDIILNKYQQIWSDQKKSKREVTDCESDQIDKEYLDVKCYKNLRIIDWNSLIYKCSKVCLILCALLIDRSEIDNVDPFKIICVVFLLNSFLND